MGGGLSLLLFLKFQILPGQSHLNPWPQPTARCFPNTPAESLSLTLTPVFPAVYWASSLAPPKGFSDLACLRENESSSFLISSLVLSVFPVFGLQHRFPVDKPLTWRLFRVFPYFTLMTKCCCFLIISWTRSITLIQRTFCWTTGITAHFRLWFHQSNHHITA